MRRAGPVLLLAALLVLTAAAPRASAVLERPPYATGDFWTYATSISEAFGLTLAGNTTLTVGPAVTISVQGEDVAALEVSVEGGGAFAGEVPGFGAISGTWTVVGTEHWEAVAWRSVRSFLQLTAEGEIPSDPAPVPFSLQLVNTTTRRTLSDTFPWPITDGAAGAIAARWNVTQNATVAFGGFPPESNETTLEADVTIDFLHNGTASVTVPAGTFAAERIEERGPEGLRVRSFAPRVGNDVLEQDYNETGGLVASSALRAFRYRAGEPAPPFPWLTVLVAVLAAVAVVLAVALALRARRRPPPEVWMPPEKESPPEGPASP